MKLASAAQMRELDRRAIEDCGIPSIDLMERAAEGIWRAAREALRGRPRCAAILCGSGNNGGDGLAAARLLHRDGVQVRVFLVGNSEKLTPDAREELRRLRDSGVEPELFDRESEEQARWIRSASICVDALFGVGLSREIRADSAFATAIRLMNECGGTVIAADIPSGVSTDTGEVLGVAVKADRTITFTLPKIGMFVGDGANFSGEATVWDIGIPETEIRGCICPVQTIEPAFAAASLPPRRPDGHKGTFGKLLVIGGAVGYTGAPYLTASAAVRAGCGLVYLGVPESIWAIEAAKCTSAMPFPLPEAGGKLSEAALAQIVEKLNGCDVLALGPGLGRSAGTQRLVWELLRRAEQPVVLDADGINALEGHIDVLDARRGRVTVLTPHDGEVARLTGKTLQEIAHGDRIGMAREFAREHGCVLILKGHRTVVASPQGNVLVNTTGNSGMAKGGSGDVLTGILASLLCQGATAMQAAGCGVWLHGFAGDLAADALTEYCVTPEDVITWLPDAIREVSNG